VSNHRSRITPVMVARLHALGLRLTKHRSYCHDCKGLRSNVVGAGTRPTCGDCYMERGGVVL
jgi:hypothetical protein